MFDNPYIQSVSIALLTAVIYSLYLRATDKDEKKPTARFLQVFGAALVAGIVFTFMTNGIGGGEDTMNEPFIAGGLADF
ncbi:hypothetical protein ATCVBr0604L_373R [Acanthocystis turfacea Chlorella virus Br0604L]|nr:hypothetical protein ATCVBr0604L_373R [Acanthocystis turfacea Chlorella virus Br0604L]AGE59741.1 hypothetical protein ATCVTN60342_367R [Acanthocystis turfacea Chlorella virus TN603.4.2]